MTSETTATIRPPWPDELGRLWELIGQSRFTGNVFPRIVVTGEPERIIAADVLEVIEGEETRLHLFIRGRFCQQEVVDLVFGEMEAIAARESSDHIALICPEAAPWRPVLEQVGYSHARTDAWWLVRWSEQVTKRFRIAKRLADSPKLSKHFTAGPPTQDDFQAMQAIAEEYGLANLERLGAEQILGASPESYSPELSRVVRRDGELVGMALVKRLGNRAFVHLRAVAKKHQGQSGQINAHLMAHCLLPEYKHITRFIFSAQPTVEKETLALAKRFGGRQIGQFCQYRKALLKR